MDGINSGESTLGQNWQTKDITSRKSNKSNVVANTKISDPKDTYTSTKGKGEESHTARNLLVGIPLLAGVVYGGPKAVTKLLKNSDGALKKGCDNIVNFFEKPFKKAADNVAESASSASKSDPKPDPKPKSKAETPNVSNNPEPSNKTNPVTQKYDKEFTDKLNNEKGINNETVTEQYDKKFTEQLNKEFINKNNVPSEETKLLNGPKETKLIDGPEETKLLNAPKETKLIDGPEETKLLNGPEGTKLINAPKEIVNKNDMPSIKDLANEVVSNNKATEKKEKVVELRDVLNNRKNQLEETSKNNVNKPNGNTSNNTPEVLDDGKSIGSSTKNQDNSNVNNDKGKNKKNKMKPKEAEQAFQSDTRIDLSELKTNIPEA